MNDSELKLIFYLKQKGIRIIDIARQSGISESTICRYLAKAKTQNLNDEFIFDPANQNSLQLFLKKTSVNSLQFYEPYYHNVYN